MPKVSLLGVDSLGDDCPFIPADWGSYTANMCSEITVEMHLKNCNFEKLQFFTVDQCSLYFLQLKNCNFNIFTVFKNTTKKM